MPGTPKVTSVLLVVYVLVVLAAIAGSNSALSGTNVDTNPQATLATAKPASQKEPFKLLRRIELGDGHLQWVAFSPDGKSVAGCGDKLVQLYDTNSGKRIRQFRGNKRDIIRFAFSPNGKMLASAGRDRTIHVWNVQSGEIITVIHGHTEPIIGINFSADGKWLASTARQPNDRTVRVWDCSTWKEKARATAPQRTNSMYVAFSPNGKYLAASGYRGAVRLYDFDGNSLRLRFERKHRNGEMAPHVIFAPDGESFITSGWDKALRCWDVKTGAQRWTADAPKYARCFEASVYSPDGSTIYSVTRDETIQAHDAKTGKLQQTFRWDDQIRGLAISPDGSKLATAGHRGTIKVWLINDPK